MGREWTSVTHRLANNGLLGLGLHIQLPNTFSSFQRMASKIFCCCCKASESTLNTADCHSPRNSQQEHPRTFSKSILGTMSTSLSYFLVIQSPQPLLARTLSLRLCGYRKLIIQLSTDSTGTEAEAMEACCPLACSVCFLIQPELPAQ